MPERSSLGDNDFVIEQTAYVVGDATKLKMALAPLKFISVKTCDSSIDQDEGEHFLIYVLSPVNAQTVIDMAEFMQEYQSILTRKIVLLPSEKSASPALTSLAAELRVGMLAAGPQSLAQVQAYLTNANAEASLVGSLPGYQSAVVQAEKQGDVNALLRHLKRIEQVCPESEDKTATLAQGYAWAGLRSYAVALLRQQLLRQPASLWAALQLAVLYLESNKPDYAVEMLERLGRHQRLNPARFYLLGEIYRRCGRLQQALQAFEHGSSLTQGKARRFAQALVQVQAALGRYDLVLNLLQGKALDGSDLSVLGEHSLMALGRHDYAQAIALLEVLLPAYDKQPALQGRVRYNLALAALGLGEGERAAAYLQATAINESAVEPVVTKLAHLLKERANTRRQEEGKPESFKQLLTQFKPLRVQDEEAS